MAYRILIPQVGMQPRAPALEAGILTTGQPGNSVLHTFMNVL